MKCPHCAVHFHENWFADYLRRGSDLLRDKLGNVNGAWMFRNCICPECSEVTIEVTIGSNREPLGPWRQVFPIGANRGPTPPEVPANISNDYVEACNVLPISSKASAALSRRCLQNILRAAGYRDKDLAREIDQLLNEGDPKKALPSKLRETIDAIRNFGNFSAHPIDDKTTLQVIEVEPHEAEWCLEVIEELFDHFYVGPALAAAKRASLNAKLKAGGKPAAK